MFEPFGGKPGGSGRAQRGSQGPRLARVFVRDLKLKCLETRLHGVAYAGILFFARVDDSITNWWDMLYNIRQDHMPGLALAKVPSGRRRVACRDCPHFLLCF